MYVATPIVIGAGVLIIVLLVAAIAAIWAWANAHLELEHMRFSSQRWSEPPRRSR